MKSNSPTYKSTLADLLTVDVMLDRHQVTTIDKRPSLTQLQYLHQGYTNPQLLGVVESWKKEREALR